MFERVVIFGGTLVTVAILQPQLGWPVTCFLSLVAMLGFWVDR